MDTQLGHILQSLVGPLTLRASSDAILAIDWGTHPIPQDQRGDPGLLKTTRAELEAYFAGKLQRFSVPVDPKGTPFQLRAWQALLQIPYGQTRSYKQQSQAIGNEKAVRAVGSANGKNPIPILIPCHRVIGSSGKLVGFAGGLAIKKALLSLEGISLDAPATHSARA